MDENGDPVNPNGVATDENQTLPGGGQGVEINLETDRADENRTPRALAKFSKKRKPDGSPVLDSDILSEDSRIDIVKAIQEVSEVIRYLFKEISDSTRIRKDIKEKTEILQGMNRELLEGKVLQILNAPVLLNTNIKVIDDITPRMKYYCDKCSVELDQEKEETKEIKSKLKEAMTYDEDKYDAFINREWPEATFEKIKEREGSPLAAREGDLIVVIDEKNEDTALLSVVKNRYPEIEELLDSKNVSESDTPEDRLQYLESSVKTKTTTNTRRVHLVETRGDKDLRIIFTKLKDENLLKGKKVTAAVSTTETRATVRKTMEIIFHDEQEVEIDFCVPRSMKAPVKEISFDQKGRKPEAVIIKTNVATYADTLRSIRSVIRPEEMGVGVRFIKRTKQNHVVIETENGQAGRLQKEIATRVQGVETRISGNSTTVNILDIDASMNGKEIEESIRKEIREFNTIVRHVRNARSGTQIATVTMPTKAAEQLLQAGDIKIGWTRCRVMPKIEVLRCYNCLKIGHHSSICKEPRGEKKCLNCAQQGHFAKDCEEESYCSTCDVTGHRCDSQKCPSYRNLVKQMREKSDTEKEKTNEAGERAESPIEKNEKTDEQDQEKMEVEDEDKQKDIENEIPST